MNVVSKTRTYFKKGYINLVDLLHACSKSDVDKVFTNNFINETVSSIVVDCCFNII